MKRRNLLTLSALSVLGLALLPSGIVAQQGSLKQQLTGSWTLLSYVTCPTTNPLTVNTKGVLILEADGRYAELFGRPDRVKFKNPGQPTTEERAAAQTGFAANYGTWSVNDADRTLNQRFEGALVPNNEGAELKSTVSLTGDELKLTRVLPSVGVRQEFVYRRAK